MNDNQIGDIISSDIQTKGLELLEDRLRLLAETRGFWQNGIHETAKTSFVKSSRNAKTVKPIKIVKLP